MHFPDTDQPAVPEEHSSFVPSSNLEQIRAYYDATWLDYRFLWLNPANLALHVGYWDEYTRSHAESLLNMNRRLAQAVRIQAGQRILDAGCGVGGGAIWLARTYGVEVVGITPVASQIARARQAAKAQGLAERVTFEQQDYVATSFPEASFDVVWAIESVCQAPEKWRFCMEMRRLLRSGGRLIVADFCRTPQPHTVADEALLCHWMTGWMLPNLGTPQQLQQWAEQAGLTAVHLQDLTEQIRPSVRRLYRIACLLTPGEQLFHLLGLRSETLHGNARAARLQYPALQRRLWCYSLLTAHKE